MKRVLTLILILVLIIGMMTFARAESIYFVAINDGIDLTQFSSEKMPFENSSVIYVSSDTFGNEKLGVFSTYVQSENKITLYNKTDKARSLVFDLNTGKTTDEDNNEYSYAARKVGGTIFVPAEFVCSHFKLGYSFLTASQGYPMVRITNGDEQYTDEGLVLKSQGLVDKKAAEYLASADQQPSPSPSSASSPSPSPSDDPEPEQSEDPAEIPDETEPPEEPTPSVPDVPRDLTISMIGISETAAVLFDTYDVKAAFFLTAEDMASDNLIRRLFCKGHSLGAAVDMSSIDSALEDLELINNVLCDIIKTKTLIVCPADPDNVSADAVAALYDLGCVVWQYGIDGDTDYETVENFVSGINMFLSGHLSGDESGERAMKLTNLLAKIGSSDDNVHAITAATAPPDESFTVMSNEIDVEEENDV